MNQPQGSGFTKQMARNIFYGGTAFFVLLFIGLIFDTEGHIPKRSNAARSRPRSRAARSSGRRATASAATRCWAKVRTTHPSWAT
jgi:hypothetical protein